MVRIKLLEKILSSNSSNSSNGASSARMTGSGGSRQSGKMCKSASLDLSQSEAQMSQTAMQSTLVTESDEPNVFASILNEHFICNCCLELLRNPVTLICGHSFCQLCLADWYLISNNRRCPICRQEWFGIPKQNQALKSTIKKYILIMLISCV